MVSDHVVLDLPNWFAAQGRLFQSLLLVVGGSREVGVGLTTPVGFFLVMSLLMEVQQSFQSFQIHLGFETLENRIGQYIKVKKLHAFLIHEADPQSWPEEVTICTHVVRL